MFVIGLGILAITLSVSIPLSFMFKEVWQKIIAVIILTPMVFYGAVLLLAMLGKS